MVDGAGGRFSDGLSSFRLRRTTGRVAIYQLLLADPEAVWTVDVITARLDDGELSAESVRATLYVLAEGGVQRARRSGNCLEFELTADGVSQLRSIVRDDGSAVGTGGQWTMTTLGGSRLWLFALPTHRCGQPAYPCPWCCEHALVVTVRRSRADTAAMTITGAFLSPTSAMVAEAVADVLRDRVRRLIVDVSSVLRVDVDAVRTLRDLRRAAHAEGRRVLFCHAATQSAMGLQFSRAGLLRST